MMMKKVIKRIALLVAVAALLTLLLPGCSTPAGGAKGSPAGSAAPSAAATTAGSNGAEATAPADGGQQATGEDEPAALAASDFKTVDKNPLNDTMQALLWLVANGPDTTPISADAGANPALKALSDKYQVLLIDPGVHYVEDSLGMETEYWIKGGKFKKRDALGQITVYDGQSYVQYDPNGKKGMRYSKDDTMASADIAYTTKGMLAGLAASPYQQLEDQKVGRFNCAVFFIDIEVMGMKGNTLFVDKETGLLVKYLMGDEKDKNISTTVTEFEAGGFGDDVFTVPADITVVDFK